MNILHHLRIGSQQVHSPSLSFFCRANKKAM